MPEIIQDLKLKSDPSTIVRPNVVSSNIPANAIKTAHIEDGAITTGKIANEAVTAAKLGPECVLRGNIAPASVSSDKLEASAVTETKIAPNAVSEDKLQNYSVSILKLKRVVYSGAFILSQFPTLADLVEAIDTHKYDFLSFMGRSVDKYFPVRYMNDYETTTLYIERYDENSGNFIMEKLQNDTDYIAHFTNNH